MVNIINSKWIVNYKYWYLAITSDKKVYDIKTKTKLVKYYNNGTIAYRLPKTTKKIGIRTINRHCKLESVIIIEYCPF